MPCASTGLWPCRTAAYAPKSMATPLARGLNNGRNAVIAPSPVVRRSGGPTAQQPGRRDMALGASTDLPTLKMLEKSLPLDSDEEDLKQLRVVYDFDRWTTHRNSWRYVRHIIGLFGPSRNIARLKVPLFLILTEATAVCVYEQALAQGLLPDGWMSVQLQLPVAYTLTSFVMSMLLVFRTNTGYGRFDEGRKLWGSVVNRSRDTMRQATTFFRRDELDLVAAFARWQAAFPWTLKNHLREEKDWEELQDILLPIEFEMLVKNPHGPSLCLAAMAEVADRASLSEDQRLQLDRNLTQFADNVGACERILRTPVPVSYTRHTSRFLVTWLTLLPLTIYEQAGWSTIPSAVLLTFFLLGIEDIGVQIEEPFMVLPLKAISTTISTNVRQHVEGMDDVFRMVNGITGTTSRAEGRAMGTFAGPGRSPHTPATYTPAIRRARSPSPQAWSPLTSAALPAAGSPSSWNGNGAPAWNGNVIAENGRLGQPPPQQQRFLSENFISSPSPAGNGSNGYGVSVPEHGDGSRGPSNGNGSSNGSGRSNGSSNSSFFPSKDDFIASRR